jgi:hypothetical protein
MRIGALLLSAVLVPAAALSGDEPGHAEYAVRWDPSQGGPANVRELLDFLGASGGGGHAYEVRYFDLPRPEGAPAGATPILRLRIADDGEAEVRLKYRTERPLEGRWSCRPEPSFEKSEESRRHFRGERDARADVRLQLHARRGSPPRFSRRRHSPVRRVWSEHKHGDDKIERVDAAGRGSPSGGVGARSRAMQAREEIQ